MDRVDVVYIRKSSKPQEDQDQIDNVERCLKAMGKYIPPQYWFQDTGSRHRQDKRKDFQRMMAMIKEGRVNTVYIETLNRFGGDARKQEFPHFIHELITHKAHLFDFKEGRDWTAPDMATQVLALIGGARTTQDQENIAHFSLRSKVGKMLRDGSWVGGPAPVGYDKICFDPSGLPRWRFRHITRTTGQVYLITEDGREIPGEEGVKHPRKSKDQINRLIPSYNVTDIENVRLIFLWYTTENISRSGIARRLNDMGRRCYNRPWNHVQVRRTLNNPAYIGDYVWGKSERSDFAKWQPDGQIVMHSDPINRMRTREECLVKPKLWEALVDDTVFADAQQKLEEEAGRDWYAPRNIEAYLKGLLTCGHCGKKLTTFTKVYGIGKRKGERFMEYVCPTHMEARRTGVKEGACDYYHISQPKMEKLIKAKLEELGITLENVHTAEERSEWAMLLSCGIHDIAMMKPMQEDSWYSLMISEGVPYYVQTTRDECGDLDPASDLAKELHRLEGREAVPTTFDALALAIQRAELYRQEYCHHRLLETEKEFRAITISWAKATVDMQKVLKDELDRLSGEKDRWVKLAIPWVQRWEEKDREIEEFTARLRRMATEYEGMEPGQRGAALQDVFSEIVLKWGRLPKRKTLRVLPNEIQWILNRPDVCHTEQPCSPSSEMLHILRFAMRRAA